jgi:hypothetical protein
VYSMPFRRRDVPPPVMAQFVIQPSEDGAHQMLVQPCSRGWVSHVFGSTHMASLHQHHSTARSTRGGLVYRRVHALGQERSVGTRRNNKHPTWGCSLGTHPMCSCSAGTLQRCVSVHHVGMMNECVVTVTLAYKLQYNVAIQTLCATITFKLQHTIAIVSNVVCIYCSVATLHCNYNHLQLIGIRTFRNLYRHLQFLCDCISWLQLGHAAALTQHVPAEIRARLGQVGRRVSARQAATHTPGPTRRAVRISQWIWLS